MISPAKEWKCDACEKVEIQTGPRAAELLPSPPYGWQVIDTTEILPPRSSQGSEGKVKMGESRQTVREVRCPACRRERVGRIQP